LEKLSQTPKYFEERGTSETGGMHHWLWEMDTLVSTVCNSARLICSSRIIQVSSDDQQQRL